MKRFVFKNFKVFVFIQFIFLFASCATLKNVEQKEQIKQSEQSKSVHSKETFIPKNFEWNELYDGFSYIFFENKEFPLRYHILKVDLTNPFLKISGYPFKNEQIHEGLNGKTLSKKLKSQNKNVDFQVIVNTSPFAGKSGKWDLMAHFTSYRNIVGIHKVCGIEFSHPLKNYSALAFESDNSAKIFKSQEEDFNDFPNVFGGFFKTSEKKEIYQFPEIHDSRTAVGVSEDGKTLFILIVEGENHSKSEGLSYPECSEIFIELGAASSMQMDGGGSATLLINGKNFLSYPVFRKNGAFMIFSVEK